MKCTEFLKINEGNSLSVAIAASLIKRSGSIPNVSMGTVAKVFYGQEPPSGESTTTKCGVNYKLLAAITEAAQWGTPSCSQPQPATNNCVRDRRSN